MPTTVPIRDLKDTAAFSRLVMESPDPVTVTKNGYDQFVVMRSEDYEGMREEVAKARLLRIVADGERDLHAGDYVDGDAFVQGLRDEYGLD